MGIMIKRVYDQSKLIRYQDGEFKQFNLPAEVLALLTDAQKSALESMREPGEIKEILPGALQGVNIKWADSGRQVFTQSWINRGLDEGWLSMSQGKIIISPLDSPPLTYSIIRVPGHYCCHCEKPIPNGNTMVADGDIRTRISLGSKHVRENHNGEPSPDPQNPSGYRQENGYTLMLDKGQDNMTREDRAALELAMRKSLADTIRVKYGRGPQPNKPLKMIDDYAMEQLFKAQDVRQPPIVDDQGVQPEPQYESLAEKAKRWKKWLGFGAIALMIIVGQEISALLSPSAVLASTAFNIAKGRAVEWYLRVDGNDPTNAVMVIAAFNSTATDATIRDLDTLAAVEADVNSAEVANTGYARKVLTDADLAAASPDDTNDRFDITFPDQTFTAIGAGTAWTHLFIGYDSDSTGGTDANILGVSWHNFSVVPDGSDIVADMPTDAVFRAS